jgi:hypothetical protein
VAALVTPCTPGCDSGLPRAGATIRALERAAAFLLVLGGMRQGIALLIAAQSILRCFTLAGRGNRAVSEYVIVGTVANPPGPGDVTRHALVSGWSVLAARRLVARALRKPAPGLTFASTKRSTRCSAFPESRPSP